MKFLVETNGDYMLHDLMGRQVIEAFRPTVVDKTPFIEVNRGTKLTVLEELDDDASDEALALAKDEAELKAAIAALPRPGSAKRDPLDHDGDGKKGGVAKPKAKG